MISMLCSGFWFVLEVYFWTQIEALVNIGFVRSHLRLFDRFGGVRGSLDSISKERNIIFYFST